MKGTGAERLMFSFSADGEPLKVYGRKFPVFDNKLVKRKQWGAVVQTAKPIVYLPFTEDTFDPGFVSGGKEFLVATAAKALEELRHAKVPSAAFPGELLADVIPAQVVTTLAVIEQTDDRDYVREAGDRLRRGAEPVRAQAGRGVPVQRLVRKSAGADAIHQSQGKWDLLAGGQALPRRKARPGVRKRRDESAECHEGGDLPDGSRARANAVGHSRGVSRPTRWCWESFRSPRTTADRETSPSSTACWRK